MITDQYCATMAQYNSWMNAKMYTLCATLTDEERKRDHRAFFRSIHGTLNHILAVDLMLLSHFTHGTPTFLPVGDLYENFNELRHRREAVDWTILEWSRSVPGEHQKVGGSLTPLGREKPQGAFVPSTRAMRCIPRFLIHSSIKASPPDLFPRESEEPLSKNA